MLIVATLGFSPLTAPVTRQDVSLFRRQSAGSIVASSSAISRVVPVVMIVLGALAFSTILSFYSRFFTEDSSIFVLIVAMLIAAGIHTVHREGDFDRHFTLHCPRAYERDALYVFTPDLKARVIDEATMFDVEIIDDWMFI